MWKGEFCMTLGSRCASFLCCTRWSKPCPWKLDCQGPFHRVGLGGGGGIEPEGPYHECSLQSSCAYAELGAESNMLFINKKVCITIPEVLLEPLLLLLCLLLRLLPPPAKKAQLTGPPNPHQDGCPPPPPPQPVIPTPKKDKIEAHVLNQRVAEGPEASSMRHVFRAKEDRPLNPPKRNVWGLQLVTDPWQPVTGAPLPDPLGAWSGGCQQGSPERKGGELLNSRNPSNAGEEMACIVPDDAEMYLGR